MPFRVNLKGTKSDGLDVEMKSYLNAIGSFSRALDYAVIHYDNFDFACKKNYLNKGGNKLQREDTFGKFSKDTAI